MNLLYFIDQQFLRKMSKFVAMKLHFFFFISSFLLSACANIIPPNGGGKDEAPPVALYNSSSNDTTSGFEGEEIEILFNEFIVLKGVQEHFYTSPPMAKPPECMAKGKNLYLSWDEPLGKDKTYLFHFGNSISDYNEGNVLSDYSFSFSTGEHIDSLSLSGTISDALTKSPKKGVFAALYIYVSNSDSLLYLERPEYIAKTDENGYFHFPNLKDSRYLLFALADEDRNLRFSLADELVGFHDQPVSADSSIVDLLLFNEVALGDSLSPLFSDSLTEYGSIIIDSLPNNLHFLEVLKNNRVVRQYPASKKTVIDSLPTGEYQFRIIEDSNENGYWDTGNLIERRQPERILYYPEKIQLRANWDLELIWKE